MALSRMGIGLGAFVGAGMRLAVAARHFPEILGAAYPAGCIPVLIGAIVGSAAAAAGRPVLGAVVGAGLSILAYLGSLPLTGVMSFLVDEPTPYLWELLLAGAIPGALGGAVAQRAERRGSSQVGKKA